VASMIIVIARQTGMDRIALRRWAKRSRRRTGRGFIGVSFRREAYRGDRPTRVKWFTPSRTELFAFTFRGQSNRKAHGFAQREPVRRASTPDTGHRAPAGG